MLLSALNFFPIPYYVFVSITLSSYDIFSFSTKNSYVGRGVIFKYHSSTDSLMENHSQTREALQLIFPQNVLSKSNLDNVAYVI